MSSKRKAPSGNPAKDPDITKLFKTLRANVELVRDLKGKVSDERFEMLRASALGLMFNYAELTGLPDPIDNIINSMPEEERQAYYDLAG